MYKVLFICIELKSELQVTKAILDTYISKQQQQEAVEGNYNSLFKILFCMIEMLQTDIYLKDKTIADLVEEKSQLSKEKSQLLELKKEKENGNPLACNN